MNIRKGVSPLIAVVLLIVFTVAVSTMIMSWMNTYTKDTTTSASANTDTVIECSRQTVNIPTTSGVTHTIDNVTVNVENNGQANTTLKKVIAYDSTGLACIISSTEFELEVGDLKNYGPINCTDITTGWDNTCIASVRVTTTCGGIYDEWLNPTACS
ncbi:type IV pilin [archaeon]|nr:type IV pilin [archaeon]